MGVWFACIVRVVRIVLLLLGRFASVGTGTLRRGFDVVVDVGLWWGGRVVMSISVLGARVSLSVSVSVSSVGVVFSVTVLVTFS